MKGKNRRRRREYYDHGVRHVRSDDMNWRDVRHSVFMYLIVGMACALIFFGVDYCYSMTAAQNWEQRQEETNTFNSLSDSQREELASIVNQEKYELDDDHRIVIGEYPERQIGQFQRHLSFLGQWGWVIALLWLSVSIYFAYADNRDDRYFVSDFPRSPFHGLLLPALTFVVWPFYLYERKVEIPHWEQETGYQPWSATTVEDLTESFAHKEERFEPLEKFVRYCRNDESHRANRKRQELDERIMQLENEEIRLDVALSQCRNHLRQEKTQRTQWERDKFSTIMHASEEIAKIWSNLKDVNGVTKIIIPDKDSVELRIVIKVRVKQRGKIYDLGDYLVTIFSYGVWACYATRPAYAPEFRDDHPNLCGDNCRESCLSTETQEYVTKHLEGGDIVTAVELISVSLHNDIVGRLGNRISRYFKQVVSPAEA